MDHQARRKLIARALNQKNVKPLSFEAFLDIAQSLGCIGVEPRNDLGRPFFDGIAPEVAGRMARERGLRLLGLSEVYAFNIWNDERAAAVQALIDTAAAAGAETVSLIPCVDDRAPAPADRARILRQVMRAILPMLEGSNVLALIEPIVFETSSLRGKAALVEAIEAVGGAGRFKLVHDTFQHSIAGDVALFAPYTAMVHISGISVPGVALDAAQDAHRVLVDARDRCGTIEQISALHAAGYSGPFSFECTEPALWQDPRLAERIGVHSTISRNRSQFEVTPETLRKCTAVENHRGLV